MSKQVIVEGKRMVVPNDATPDEIDQIFKSTQAPKITASQQLTNAPNQEGLQPTTTAMQHLGKVASSAYDAIPILGQLHSGSAAIQDFLQKKVAERQQQNEGAIAKGQTPQNSNMLTNALRVGGDTAGLVSGATSPTSAAIAGTALASPVVAGAGILGLGGYQAYKNKDAMINAMTTGQANPDQLQQGLYGLSTMAAGGAGVRSGEVAPLRAKPTDADIAKMVTDTVNPAPKTMPAFGKSVEANLPEVLQGKQITSRAELGQAFRERAEANKQAYYDNLLTPAKDVEVSTNYIKNYGGAEKTYGQSTVAQLDARLTDINADLRQYYEKGGEAARASLQGSKTPADLNAEAAGIREVMNKAISKQTGVPVEQVATARQKFGQQFDVADKIQQALSKERYAANEQAKQPPDLKITALGVANKAYRAVKGNVADSNLRKALSK